MLVYIAEKQSFLFDKHTCSTGDNLLLTIGNQPGDNSFTNTYINPAALDFSPPAKLKPQTVPSLTRHNAWAGIEGFGFFGDKFDITKWSK